MSWCAGWHKQQNASWLLIWLALASYAAGFVIFYPGAMVVSDETYYVAQANAFARGHVYETSSAAFKIEKQQSLPSTYPPGTSLLQAPFVWLGGWRAARFASLFSLTATVLLLAKWLQRTERPVWFALLFLIYPPVLVLGRVGMSDLPSALVVLTALYLFWIGQDRRWLWFVAAGIAGASLLFRETNVLVFVPLFGSAILGREGGWLHLVAGTAAGVAIRLMISHVIFGQALFFRTVWYGFSVHAIPQNLLVYLLALLIMVPGGLALALAYRGKRRWAVITAIALHVLFYLDYNYNASESGPSKQLILAPRFFIPLLPLLIFAMAEAGPRLWRRWNDQSLHSTGLQRGVAAVFAVLAVVAAFSVHPFMARFSRSQRSITEAIYGNTRQSAPILTNPLETSKFISSVYGDRVLLDYESIACDHLNRLRQQNGPVYLVLLQRTESGFFRAESRKDEQFLAATQQNCPMRLLHDQWHDTQNRLRIWEVGECREQHSPESSHAWDFGVRQNSLLQPPHNF